MVTKETIKQLKNIKDKVKLFLGKYNTKVKEMLSIILFIIGMIAIPLYLQANCNNFSLWLKKQVKIGTARDWLNFWSSYVGSIMSIAFAYINTKRQINIEGKKEKIKNDFTSFVKIRNINEKYTDKFNKSINRIKKSPSQQLDNSVKAFMKLLNKFLNEIETIHIEQSNKIFQIYQLKIDKFNDIFKKIAEKEKEIYPARLPFSSQKNLTVQHDILFYLYTEFNNNFGRFVIETEDFISKTKKEMYSTF